MAKLPSNSVDAVITDPPYGLSDHKPSEVAACLMAWCNGKPYASKGSGFMGKSWDAWVPGPEVWKEALRVLKPGGHLLAFAGTRSMDLMSMSLRLAGFELRDSIGYAHDGGSAPLLAWAFGSGFPKSHNISKAIDKAAGAEREVVGVLTSPCGCKDGTNALGGSWQESPVITTPATDAARQWQGWGSALKPAFEPILLCRKPIVGTLAENVQSWGTGGINVDGCRVGNESRPKIVGDYKDTNNNVFRGRMNNTLKGGSACEGVTTQGRWPANVIHDGSEAVLSGFPGTISGGETVYAGDRKHGTVDFFQGTDKTQHHSLSRGTGSAARYFYCAKASKADRDEGLEPGGNNHVTVKPESLMRYLCRLVTPLGGVILDPFMGSGSTGKAAYLEGFEFIGIERESDYIEIARARITAAVQRSEKMDIEDRLQWLETQVRRQGDKIAKIEAKQQLSLFDELAA